MSQILWQTLKGQRNGMAMIGLGALAFAVLLPTTYAAFGSVIGDLMEALPAAFRALIKADGGLSATATGYIAIGYRDAVFMAIIIGAVIAASSAALAREIERGAMFLLLARPLQRYHIVLAKAGALVLMLAVIVSLSFLGTWIGVLGNGIDGVSFGALALALVNAFMLALAVGGYSFLLSALSSEGGRVISIATGLTVVFFFVDYLATLWSPARSLGPFSVFHYYDPHGVVETGSAPAAHLLVLGCVAVAGFLAAGIVFQRRDIAG